MAKKDQDKKIDMLVAEVLKPKFNFYLVVRNPFQKYQKGMQITQDSEIQAIIDCGDLANCVKVSY